MLTLRFFASAADEAGCRESRVAFQSTPRRLLESESILVSFRGRPDVRVAVNRVWADWDTSLKDGDEVAFLPPVSGG
jgi:molybdopterin synthase sulfur carrier subunit